MNASTVKRRQQEWDCCLKTYVEIIICTLIFYTAVSGVLFLNPLINSETMRAFQTDQTTVKVNWIQYAPANSLLVLLLCSWQCISSHQCSLCYSLHQLSLGCECNTGTNGSLAQSILQHLCYASNGMTMQLRVTTLHVTFREQENVERARGDVTELMCICCIGSETEFSLASCKHGESIDDKHYIQPVRKYRWLIPNHVEVVTKNVTPYPDNIFVTFQGCFSVARNAAVWKLVKVCKKTKLINAS